ncbi:myb-interacting protein 40 isoform X2 [Tachypleus tridentatus]|uniref:myb-interacting protein 40 isoform X2 n=1 Tax=Tachypleus tridentatus TaxID=6853 RepID=UPI003FD18805
MSSVKVKQEKTAPELLHARSNLGGVLQNLMDKTDESPSSSDEEDRKPLDIKQPSPVSSPAKRTTTRSQRKRKRKDDTSAKNANSYVMKLYDRSVDLALFKDCTSLYPVCRAWICNQPQNYNVDSESRSPSPQHLHQEDDATGNEKSDNVYSLPPPKPPQTKDGKEKRIPSPLPQEQQDLIISSDDTAPSKECLMGMHMARWRTIRQRWRETGMKNEERYRESGDTLKAMFERSLGKEDGVLHEQWDTVITT